MKKEEIDKNTFIVDVINNTGNEEDIELKVYAKLFDADGNIINMFTGWDFFKQGETQETIYLHSRSDDKYNIDVDKIDHIEYFVRASKRQ